MLFCATTSEPIPDRSNMVSAAEHCIDYISMVGTMSRERYLGSRNGGGNIPKSWQSH